MLIAAVTEKLSGILNDYLDGDPGGNLIGENTRPLGDMKGFESDFIPEVVRRLARELFGHAPSVGHVAGPCRRSGGRRRRGAVSRGSAAGSACSGGRARRRCRRGSSAAGRGLAPGSRRRPRG